MTLLSDDRQTYSLAGKVVSGIKKLAKKLQDKHRQKVSKEAAAIDNTRYFDYEDAIRMLDDGDITIAEANQMLKSAGYPSKDVQTFTKAYSGLKGRKTDPRMKELEPPTQREVDDMLDEAMERGDFVKGGLLEQDRYELKDGGDPNPGITALRKEAPEVVERMGYEDGGMLPDEEMEDNYLDFIIDEALDEEEEDMLMSKLEQDEQLSMLFDKVIEVASEFAGSGPVEGPGSGVSDSIPARLSDGEFVFTAKATEQIGADELMRMMKDAEAAAERQGMVDGGLNSMMENDSDEDLEESEQEIRNQMMGVNPRYQ